MRWAYGHEDPSIVDLTLTPRGRDHALLRLDHIVLGDEQATGYGAGWEDLLARLEAAVTGRDPGFESVEPQLAPRWAGARPHARPAPLPRVTRTGATARLDLDRWVAAEPAVVWECLVTADGLRRWYVTDVSGALSPGGRFRCVFDRGAATGEVLRCDPARELSVRWQWEGVDQASRMTVTLTAQTRDGVGGTRVAWREDDATGDVVAYGAGLHAHLAGLDRAARGLTSSETRWTADFGIALSRLKGHATDPFGG
ncbi:MAG: SRPBCC domain-containing protein [Lapillicoccus sp.]